MGRGNKDRYGYRHRSDDSHQVGESAPGTTGDSEGTFHDRSRKDSRVIVDGEVQSIDAQKSSESTSNEQEQSQSRSQKSSGGLAEGETTVRVERISGSGNAIAVHDGTHVHVEGGEVGETYTVELEAKSGYYIGKPVQKRNKA